VEFYAPFRQLNWKRRRMRAFLFTALDCFVRNKPGVTAASQITSAGVRPTSDVALVLIRNSDCESIDLDPSGLREMKNVFVAVVKKSFRADRFKVAKRSIFHRDRFDPMDRVLEKEETS